MSLIYQIIGKEERRERREGKERKVRRTSLLESSSKENDRDLRLTFPTIAPAGVSPWLLLGVEIGENPKRLFVIIVVWLLLEEKVESKVKSEIAR